MALEEAVGSVHRVAAMIGEQAVTRKECSPSAPAKPVADGVAGDRSAGGDHDDERECEVTGRGEAAGRQQGGFAG